MFKELGEKVGTIKPEKEDIVDKMQPEIGILKRGMKELLYMEVHDLDLEVMLGLEGEVILSEKELGE